MKCLSLNVKFSVIGLTKQPSLSPDAGNVRDYSKAIAAPIKPHHPILQLPRYLDVGSQLSKKVTTGNIDETRISADAFTLVTSLLNIAKD